MTESVRVMGVIDVSPESFYKGPVRIEEEIASPAISMEKKGADIIDIGTNSTSPFLASTINF